MATHRNALPVSSPFEEIFSAEEEEGEEGISLKGISGGAFVRSAQVFEHMSATTAVSAKTISARAAWAEEIAGGSRNRTVNPPSSAWRRIAANAAPARSLSVFLFLSKKKNIAPNSKPTNVETPAATSRCPCS